MKSWFKRIGLFLVVITAVVILFLKVAPTVLLGRWLFDLFGLISYEPPLSQHIQSIVQVDLLDTSDQELTVLYSITGEEIDQFVDDFMQIEAGRFANDPILEYGDRMIRICYSDGGYDLHGDTVEFYSSTGERLSTRGWYYIHDNDIDAIFEKYID